MRQILYFQAASDLFPNLQVDGKAADLWAAFRAWCAETFCSTEDMVGAPRITVALVAVMYICSWYRRSRNCEGAWWNWDPLKGRSASSRSRKVLCHRQKLGENCERVKR